MAFGLGVKVCEALGLDASKTHSLDIHIGLDDVGRVTVGQYMGDELAPVLRRYKLAPYWPPPWDGQYAGWPPPN